MASEGIPEHPAKLGVEAGEGEKPPAAVAPDANQQSDETQDPRKGAERDGTGSGGGGMLGRLRVTRIDVAVVVTLLGALVSVLAFAVTRASTGDLIDLERRTHEDLKKLSGEVRSVATNLSVQAERVRVLPEDVRRLEKTVTGNSERIRAVEVTATRPSPVGAVAARASHD